MNKPESVDGASASAGYLPELLMCPQCGTVYGAPFDVGDQCVCGGHLVDGKNYDQPPLALTDLLGGRMNTIDCPKCEHEHQPSGSHDDDHGERTCDACGFTFMVEIEYDPSYCTSCVDHEYGEFGMHATSRGEMVECRFCVHCQHCQLRENVAT